MTRNGAGFSRSCQRMRTSTACLTTSATLPARKAWRYCLARSYGRKVMGAKSCAQRHARKFTAVKVGQQPPRAREDLLARERRVPAAHRRHDELFAAAGARVDVGAGAEAQVLAEANAHF